ncbi:uncharacterized protein LOC127279624 [Leptopilina boulardi]|uniref:uncharacterized protein LOC127279624 n=1 Tax=Leptopilina boulardi TaxID=63433 RepID=UPI0021F5C77D|nr:uncharacterized protein LOC127279624 [Leptopilina boulardi]
MIEWIGIICCSSLISCVCSLLTTSICLTVTGGKLRRKSKNLANEKSQDVILNSSRVSNTLKTNKLDNISRQTSQSPIVSSRKQSFEKNQSSSEFQQKSVEYLKKMENTSKKDFCDNTTCKYSTTAISVCCNIPTEAEIQKIIDEFNTLFRQYNEIISKNPKQDIKNTQSSMKFHTNKIDQINVGVMTDEHENREIISYKSHSKIRKCKCTIKRHSSNQSVKTRKSCICNFRKSKSDMSMRKAPSLKSINNSNYFVKSPMYSKQHINSKPNWISKTMKKFKSKDDRK